MEYLPGRVPGAEAQKRTGGTFAGDVWLDPLLPSSEGVTINTVYFAPGAHTYWHWHERGQILMVTSGEGWVVPRDQQAKRVRTGDTLWVPPGEQHWHGAAPDSFLVHVAISMGETRWLERVSENGYANPMRGTDAAPRPHDVGDAQ